METQIQTNGEIKHKICGRCKNDLPLSEFGTSLSRNKKHRFTITYCKSCIRKASKIWYGKNRLRLLKKQTELYHGDPLVKKRSKAYSKKHYKKNKVAFQARSSARKRWRYHNDPEYKILHNLRSRLNHVLKGERKSDRTVTLLGCTVAELKKHLESLFKTGMTWDNYKFRGWHIDHIKSCSKFDLSKPEEQRKCFHYTNLQPLWWWENLAKH